jgi:hypothetical protein
MFFQLLRVLDASSNLLFSLCISTNRTEGNRRSLPDADNVALVHGDRKIGCFSTHSLELLDLNGVSFSLGKYR